ncbi:hypothetical protein VI06_03365 [Aquitalea magnusonii]|nr:hypothetical protein VI06_03365 [Aquitalea magnusonii]
MPKTDYGQMLADIHNQVTDSIKKVTPELAKRINMVAIDLDGNVRTSIESYGLRITIQAAPNQKAEALHQVMTNHFPDCEDQHYWIDEEYRFTACASLLKSGVEISVKSKQVDEKHAA